MYKNLFKVLGIILIIIINYKYLVYHTTIQSLNVDLVYKNIPYIKFKLYILKMIE